MFTYLPLTEYKRENAVEFPRKRSGQTADEGDIAKNKPGEEKAKPQNLDDFIWQDVFGIDNSIFFILVAFSVFAVSTCTSNVSESKHMCLSNYRRNVLVRKHTDILNLDCFGDTRLCCYRYKQHHINTITGRSCDPFLLDNPKRKTDNSHVDVSMTLLPFLNRFEEALPSALFLGDHV